MDELMTGIADGVNSIDWTAVSNGINSIDWNAIADGVMGILENILDFCNSNQVGGIIALIFGMIMIAVCAVVMITVFCAIVCCCIVAAVYLIFAFVTDYLLPAIALFKMGRSANYPHPWFAFIPFLQTYMEYTLPRREFKALFIRLKTEDRFIIAIISIIVSTVFGFVSVELKAIPVVGWLIIIVVSVFLYAFRWRKKYDLLYTFGGKKVAIPVSIIGLFIPLVYAITLLVIMGREPENRWPEIVKKDRKAVKNKAAASKTEENKAAEDKATEDKAAEDKAAESKSAESGNSNE